MALERQNFRWSTSELDCWGPPNGFDREVFSCAWGSLRVLSYNTPDVQLSQGIAVTEFAEEDESSQFVIVHVG
jgi:hypothetical protein